jgi:phage shock protein PspC (stress-responsive transcriptional regulator)
MSSPYPPQPPKRLVRSTSNRIIGGVCGGVADYLNMDANLVRILTVLISLFTGVPVILYIIALFVVPEDNTVPTAPPPVTGASPYSGPVLRDAVLDRAARVRAVPGSRRDRSPSAHRRGRRLGQRGCAVGAAAAGGPHPGVDRCADRSNDPGVDRAVRAGGAGGPAERGRAEADLTRPSRPLKWGLPSRLCGRCASGGANQVQEVAVDPPVVVTSGWNDVASRLPWRTAMIRDSSSRAA